MLLEQQQKKGLSGNQPLTSANNADVVLYQLSYQANWELVIMWVLINASAQVA